MPQGWSLETEGSQPKGPFCQSTSAARHSQEARHWGPLSQLLGKKIPSRQQRGTNRFYSKALGRRKGRKARKRNASREARRGRHRSLGAACAGTGRHAQRMARAALPELPFPWRLLLRFCPSSPSPPRGASVARGVRPSLGGLAPGEVLSGPACALCSLGAFTFIISQEFHCHRGPSPSVHLHPNHHPPRLQRFHPLNEVWRGNWAEVSLLEWLPAERGGRPACTRGEISGSLSLQWGPGHGAFLSLLPASISHCVLHTSRCLRASSMPS